MNDEQPKSDNMKRERRLLSILLDETEKKAPRLFNIIMVIIIPLILLICLAMLCGHFLAVLESENELDTLHDTMTSFISNRAANEGVSRIVEKAYEECLDGYIKSHADQLINGTELGSYIENCTTDGLKYSQDLMTEIETAEASNVFQSSSSLNWNRCFYDGNKTELPLNPANTISKWFEVWTTSFYGAVSTIGEIDAFEIAKQDAKDALIDNCEVNSAGGAVFWFTIMTTIGYGNTAPVTKNGRALVFTAGFISILIFAAISGAAGYVSLAIADDFFQRVKLKMLTKGWPSIFFWFSIIWLWILVLAGVNELYTQNRYSLFDVSDLLEEQVWWAYISITTVGFGDHFIPHETFLLTDIWYMPLIMLIGFVFVANFLLKLSDLISDILKKSGITDDESLNFLLSQRFENNEIDQAPLEEVEIQDDREGEEKKETSLAEEGSVPGKENSEKERSRISIILDQTEKKAPRSFNVMAFIIIPLILLICLALLCGHFLAVFESGHEIDTLHDTLLSFIDSRGANEFSFDGVKNTYDDCIKNHIDQLIVGSELRDSIDICKEGGLQNVRAVEWSISANHFGEVVGGLTLNWNRCFYKGNETELPLQAQLYGLNWIDVWGKSYAENEKTLGAIDAIEAANQDAKDAMMTNCEVNSAGGALFWFTIMTTIGYGNTAPVTTGGQVLVYTAGFVSILIFTALTGAAGYVFLTIADDFLLNKIKLKCLTKGWPSVFLWFSVLWLWILVLAGVRGQFQKDRYEVYDSLEPLEDRIWWAYITMTTVGFGDFYFPHETFLFRDAWWLLPLILIGFVFLANFLLKFAGTVSDALKKSGITDDESLNYLLKQSMTGDAVHLDDVKAEDGVKEEKNVAGGASDED